MNRRVENVQEQNGIATRQETLQCSVLAVCAIGKEGKERRAARAAQEGVCVTEFHHIEILLGVFE